ncbi:MAG: hypothetical protein K2K44_03670 [Oscillospiraceae bacterium]|nr:hypothetical protein [Oscillospiraceae bacterium]
MDIIYKLKKEYSASGVPTVIADEELNILWKNNTSVSDRDIGHYLVESADFVFDGGVPDTGLTVKEINGEICTFNIIKTEDAENGKRYYIIELIGSRSFGGSVSAETVRGYVGYICSRIRAAAGKIASVTDRLFGDISSGGLNAGRISEGFDLIHESIARLERETFYPERIYSLTDPEKPDDIIILDKEMTAVVSGIKSFLNDRNGSTVRISEDYDREIFFRMNTDSFETAVASMAAECCGDGRGFGCVPERIIFSTRRSGRDRAEIAVMSLHIGKKDDAAGSPHERIEESSFNKKLLAEYIYDVLSLKNGVRFSKENIPGGFVFRMNIEALPRGASVFAEKPVDGSGRRREISEKLDFFFGDMPKAEGCRYTSGRENESGSELDCNIYREDIENERSEI